MKRVLTTPLVAIAVVLLLGDAFFVAAEMMHRMYRFYGHFPWFWHEGWEANPDGSFLEIWGYAKSTTAGILLIVLWRKLERSPVLLVTAVLLFVVALDDSLQFHEIGGGKLVRALDLPAMFEFGLRGQDVGELMIWAAIGLPLLIAAIAGYLRSAELPRRITHSLVPPFAVLIFFAIGVDMISILAWQWDWPGRAMYLLELTETTGEIVALTGVLLVPIYYLLNLSRIRDAKDPNAVKTSGPASL